MDSKLDKLVGERETDKANTELLQAIAKDESATRQKVAKLFFYFFFCILILIIISVPLYNYFIYSKFKDATLLISLKDTILTYSAVTGSTFGLVVAYYFKSSKD